MATMADAVQMNTRLERSLKREGDAALAAEGYTPSQAVRAVYQLSVRLRRRPGKLRALLESGVSEVVPSTGDSAHTTYEDPRLARHYERLARVNAWIEGLSADAAAASAAAEKVESVSDEDLKREIYFERYWEERQ